MWLRKPSTLVVFLAAALLAWPAFAQSIPQPSGPVLFCGQQASPPASAYEVVVDGGTPAPLAMDATKDARCPAAATHSFKLPAAQFLIGQHTVVVRALNAFGATVGPTYTLTVGVAPGAFTITAVNP